MQPFNLDSRASTDQPWHLRVAWGLGSLAGFLLFWELMALLIQHRHLPGPGQVFLAMQREFASGQLLFHIGMTLYRVVIAFIFAMLIGSSIGIIMGRSARVDRIFDGWLILFLNLPALVIIFLCYVWLGFTEVAAIVAVAVNKIPNVAVTVREGARSLSRDLDEMAHMYRFGRWKTLRHVTLPQLSPFFLAAARTGLSLVW